jgi:hypothetical protein
MRIKSIRLSPLPLAAASLAIIAAVSGCGGDESTSSPTRPDAAADAGLDAETSVSEDVQQEAPPNDTSVDGPGDTSEEAPLDSDGDGVPDTEDTCPGFDDHADKDDDGLPDDCDDCPDGDNDVDSDGDGIADGCDICPGFDDSIDTSGSGVPDCRTSLKLWLRADRDVFADDGAGAVGSAAQDGQGVRQWEDQGTWNHHAAQTDPKRMPTFVQGVAGSGPTVRFKGADAGGVDDLAQVDSLDGPSLILSRAARTVFVVARASEPLGGTLLELNRGGTTNGGQYRITPEIAVRVGNGNAMFAHHPLDDQLHVVTVQSPSDGSTADIRAWYDGIPIDASSVAPRVINTGTTGYRLGDGNELGSTGLVGDVAEVILYERALSGAEHAKVGLTLEREHGLKTWYVEQEQPVAVYLMAGQSNMVGQGVGEELTAPLNTTQGDVMAWASVSIGWSPLRWGTGNGPTQFGPELSFGRAMADSDAQARVAIVKYAVNGTNLAQDWAPGVGSVYTDFNASITAARQRLDGLSVPYEIRGLLWMQGESDALDETMAASYQQNMTAFIESVRGFVGVADMPVVIARIRGTMPAPFYHSLAVRMAQESVAAGDANVRIIDTDPLTLHADGVHYDTAGQLALGQAFATAMLQMAPP